MGLIEQDAQASIECALLTGQNLTSQSFRLEGVSGLHKFLFVKKGIGRCMVDGQTHGFGPNSVLIIPDQRPHRVEIGINATVIGITIPNTIEVRLPDNPVIHAIENSGDAVGTMQLFETVLHEYNSGDPGAMLAVESYVGLISVQIQRMLLSQDEPTLQTAASRLMRQFSNLVEQEFHTGKNINAYAESLGITPTHLTRICRQLNGVSASQFLQQRILNESTYLLRATNHRINMISKMLGFSNPAYFSRFFQERVGKSPKEFRMT